MQYTDMKLKNTSAPLSLESRTSVCKKEPLSPSMEKPTWKAVCIDFAALRAKANGVSKKQLKKARAKQGRSREGIRVETPHVSGDGRSHGGEREVHDPVDGNGKGKTVETEYVAAPKRPRVDPEVPYAFHSGGDNQLFTYGVNRDGKESLWDLADHRLAMKKTEGFIGEYDRGRMSANGRAHMLALLGGDICRVLAIWRFLMEAQAKEGEERARRVANEMELRAQHEAVQLELTQKEHDLKVSRREVEELNRCYDLLKEKYETEKKTGKMFLATSGGAAYREVVAKEAERRFVESEICRAMIEEKAIAAVYTPLVRSCRRYLREVGGIDDDVIRGMEPGIPDEGEEVDEMGTEITDDPHHVSDFCS
ncbi:hypothetical protein ABFS82_08G121200 [Erythranthe guttata]